MKQNLAKNTVEAIARLIENADKQTTSGSNQFSPNIITMLVSNNGEIVSPADLATLGDDSEALRLTTILSEGTCGVYPTNELDNTSRDIAREIFGEQVKRVIIWTRWQAKSSIVFKMIDVNRFEGSVNRTRSLLDMIDELYDDNGFIVTGIY